MYVYFLRESSSECTKNFNERDSDRHREIDRDRQVDREQRRDSIVFPLDSANMRFRHFSFRLLFSYSRLLHFILKLVFSNRFMFLLFNLSQLLVELSIFCTQVKKKGSAREN
jgi:hypothetical protein